MKQFILENIYTSTETPPYVVSIALFSSPEEAKKEGLKQLKKEAKDYRKSYGADNISTEECYRDLYIKGPDFTDWWTIVEIPNNAQ